jgi:hypothetical protein
MRHKTIPGLSVSSLLWGMLNVGCVKDGAGLHSKDTINHLGSDTNTASGSASTGSSTNETGFTDNAPTLATTMMAETTIDPTSAGCSFQVCNDMPPEGCDPYVQACPEGQKCTYVASDGGNFWDATKCVDVTGMHKPGDECTTEGTNGTDSCIKGAVCLIDQDGVGTCFAMCSGSFVAPTCDEMSVCAMNDGLVQICVPICNPLLQDCDPAEACHLIGGEYHCAPDNSGDPGGKANDSCLRFDNCDKGLMCGDAAFVGMACADSLSCCTPFCKFPDGPCPNPDQQCVQVFNPMELPPEDPRLDIGVCGVPF